VEAAALEKNRIRAVNSRIADFQRRNS